MRRALTALALCTPVFMLLTVPAFAARHHEKKVIVHMTTSEGKDGGTATFTQESHGRVKLALALRNMTEGAHGIHIHEHVVCDAPDFKTAGGHFNPDMKQHGFKNPSGHHAGDLPDNLDIGVEQPYVHTFTLTSVSMGTGQANDILANGGTSLMIHAKPDDMMTDPSGNSGNRVACGVITDGHMEHKVGASGGSAGN